MVFTPYREMEKESIKAIEFTTVPGTRNFVLTHKKPYRKMVNVSQIEI